MSINIHNMYAIEILYVNGDTVCKLTNMLDVSRSTYGKLIDIDRDTPKHLCQWTCSISIDIHQAQEICRSTNNLSFDK